MSAHIYCSPNSFGTMLTIAMSPLNSGEKKHNLTIFLGAGRGEGGRDDENDEIKELSCHKQIVEFYGRFICDFVVYVYSYRLVHHSC